VHVTSIRCDGVTDLHPNDASIGEHERHQRHSSERFDHWSDMPQLLTCGTVGSAAAAAAQAGTAHFGRSKLIKQNNAVTITPKETTYGYKTVLSNSPQTHMKNYPKPVVQVLPPGHCGSTGATCPNTWPRLTC
jgi:hypothetical protein